VRILTAFKRLKMQPNGVLFWAQWYIFKFCKRQGISWLAQWQFLKKGCASRN
jgi:hypothetical protein